MIWVLDASIAVRWLIKDEEDRLADSILEKVVESPQLFAVPELFSYETYAVLCRLHPTPLEAFLEGISPILNNGILRSPMTEDLARDAHPFAKMGLTGYDACYAALSLQLGGTWLTFDERAHRRIARAGVSHPLTRGLPPGWPAG